MTFYLLIVIAAVSVGLNIILIILNIFWLLKLNKYREGNVTLHSNFSKMYLELIEHHKPVKCRYSRRK